MFDDVVTLLADRLSTRFLKANVTDENPSTLRTSTILAAPASVTALAEALDDPARSATVLELLRSAVPVGLPASATLADIWQDPFAAESATNLLFGDDRDRVAAAISGETGVSESAAGGVVTLSVLAVFATVAKQFGQADQYTIAASLEQERHEMSARGWDLWLTTVMGEASVEAEWPVDSPSPTQTAELALPLLSGEPARTHAPDSGFDTAENQALTQPAPPQIPGNGLAARVQNSPVPASPPLPPTVPEQPRTLEASVESSRQGELSAGSPQPAGLPAGPDMSQDPPADAGSHPVSELSSSAGQPNPEGLAPEPVLPGGLMPNGNSGPPSVLPPEPDHGRASVPPPDRRLGQTPAPQPFASHEQVEPEVSSRPPVPQPERDLAIGSTPRSNYGDVPSPAPTPPVPNFERPQKSDSARGDEAVRLMGGALLVLGVLVAIGVLQYWRGNNETDTEATGSVQQVTTDSEGAGGDDEAGSGDGTSTDTGTEDGSPTTTAPAAQGDNEDGTPAAPALLQREFSIPMIDPLQRADASGVANIVLDASAEEVCWSVDATGIGAPYDGHIHVGPLGVKGGIVVDFGPVENGESSCIDVAMNDIQAIIAEPAGYYVEMHDPSGDFTIRAQLSDDPIPPPPDGELAFDPTGDGATTKISAGQILLEGPVPDQETMDRLVFEVSGLDESQILVVNDLVIDESADRPTGLITVADSILFAVDSAEIEAGSAVIDDLALLFTARSDWVMTITGHTDSAGDDVYNLELSLERASAVRDALVELGVEAERLRTVGAGSTSPVASNDTEDGRQLNRRIEFRVDRN